MTAGFVKIVSEMGRTAVKEKSFVARLLILLLLSACGCSDQGSAPPARIPDLAPHVIIQRILTGGPGPETVVEGETVYSLLLVRSFYRARDYQPAWSRDGRLMQAETLLKAVAEAYGDGLTPGYYHLGRIKALVTAIGQETSPSPARLADIDILLSDAFITLGCHLSGGCVDPVTIKAEWFAKRTQVDVASVLEQALRKKQQTPMRSQKPSLLVMRSSPRPKNYSCCFRRLISIT